MLVKFFDVKNGGSSASIDYLLDKRVSQGTARVLRGNESITRRIIDSITNKQKTCVGCLSFEESDIDESLKYKLMQDFENMLLPEMQGHYNILWVEHRDKGRLELNFVIPKIDLKSEKSLNPYYHPVDSKRVDAWQDLTNLTYEFSDPKDPMKARGIYDSQSKKKNLFTEYHQLDRMLKECVAEGTIQNRDHLIEILKNSKDVEDIPRIGADYITVKLVNQPKRFRFKGDIYAKTFTSTRALGEDFKERAGNYAESKESAIGNLHQKLRKYIQSKIDFYNERNQRTRTEAYRRDFRDSNLETTLKQLDSGRAFNVSDIHDSIENEPAYFSQYNTGNNEVLNDERDFESYVKRAREARATARNLYDEQREIRARQSEFEREVENIRNTTSNQSEQIKRIINLASDIFSGRLKDKKQESLSNTQKNTQNDFRGNSDSNKTYKPRRR